MIEEKIVLYSKVRHILAIDLFIFRANINSINVYLK
jgi:hypothetical protein